MTVLKASVVGCGKGGTGSIQALQKSSRYELVAVTDLLPEVCEKTKALYPEIQTFTDHVEMFDQCPVDVVCVSTYPPSHKKVTLDAIKHNQLKGILVEKPLGDTARDGREIIAAIKKQNLPMVVPHGMLATEPGVEVIKQVKAGAIGKLTLVEFQVTNQDIINAGIHLLNYFINLLDHDDAVDYILATCETSSKTYRDGMKVETTAVTYGQTQKGVRVVLNSGDKVLIAKSRGAGHLIRLVGSEGFIEFRKADPCYTILNAKHPNGCEITPPQLKRTGHFKLLEDMADMIETGKTCYTIPDTSLDALEMVEAAYLSSRHQCKVTFPLSEFVVPERNNWNAGTSYNGEEGTDARSI